MTKNDLFWEIVDEIGENIATENIEEVMERVIEYIVDNFNLERKNENN